jgi:hypothetical protein
MPTNAELLERQAQPQNTPKDTDISGQEWFRKLSPEKQQQAQDLFTKLSELQKRADTLIATKKITGNALKSLEKALGRVPGASYDLEAKPTLALLGKWKNEFAQANSEQTNVDQKITALTTQLQVLSGAITEAEKAPVQNENLKISQEELAKMSNAKFLETPANERLRYITKWNTESADITSWKAKEVDFTFTFEGKFNQDMYLYTTAGQVLPKEVRSIESDGKTYERLGLSGEFFDVQDNKRLIIKEGTHIQVSKLANESDLKELSSKNQETYKKFISEHKEYQGEKYQPLIEMALEKWIEPEFFVISAERRVEEFGEWPLDAAEIEELATDIHRSLSWSPKISWKYPLETATRIFRYTNPTTWKEWLEKYGFKKEEIEEYDTKNPDKKMYNLGGMEDFVPAEYSLPAEKSESGTTLCSRTAFMNLERMGVKNAPRGWSAKQSFDLYGKSAMEFPPRWNGDAQVADLYLDATPKNKQYGHRVAAFKKWENWYVLDPYYALPWIGRTRQPIPAETYVSAMRNHYGKNIWWAHYYNETQSA